MQLNNRSKEEIIKQGFIDGLKYFVEDGGFKFKNKYDNPITVFLNIMDSDDRDKFTEKLYNFIAYKYKNTSLKELKIIAVKKLVGETNKDIIDNANDNVIVNYISLEVISKINDIYSKLQKQSEIIFGELEIK